MARFTFSWEEQGCGKCGQPLQVRLTRQRTVFSVAHGKFVAIERQGHCPNHTSRLLAQGNFRGLWRPAAR